MADLEKVAKHHGLALGSHPGTLGQRSGDFRGHIRRAGQKRLELHVVRVDPPAHIAALWKVGGVKLGHAFEVRVAQMELLFQPREFRLLTALQAPHWSSAGEVNAAIGPHRRDQTQQENEKAFLHPITGGEFGKD